MANLRQVVKERYVLFTKTQDVSIAVLRSFCGKGHIVAIIENQQIRTETYLDIIEQENGWTTFHPEMSSFCELRLYKDWEFLPCTVQEYLNRY